ncbi:hypothetical protein ACMHYJ_11735 [Castellaniella hirudinis]|uniref:hypothetical protein n=1 Tax=Castellaniella hirudinis TaxID=1144617 RepID=UPI0039C04E36
MLHTRDLMWILWPSFLIGGVASGLVFALVDPLDLVFLGEWRASRLTVYTLGFFLFWAMAALSSALTLRLAPRGVMLDEFGDPID